MPCWQEVPSVIGLFDLAPNKEISPWLTPPSVTHAKTSASVFPGCNNKCRPPSPSKSCSRQARIYDLDVATPTLSYSVHLRYASTGQSKIMRRGRASESCVAVIGISTLIFPLSAAGE